MVICQTVSFVMELNSKSSFLLGRGKKRRFKQIGDGDINNESRIFVEINMSSISPNLF